MAESAKPPSPEKIGAGEEKLDISADLEGRRFHGKGELAKGKINQCVCAGGLEILRVVP